MKIEHMAIWVGDLNRMKHFYEKYFEAKAGKRYHNQKKEFSSYFLSFYYGCRLELMHRPGISPPQHGFMEQYQGLAHFAISLASKEKVNRLTSRIADEGYQVLDGPRLTGDGYYESVILDPENNRIELTI